MAVLSEEQRLTGSSSPVFRVPHSAIPSRSRGLHHVMVAFIARRWHVCWCREGEGYISTRLVSSTVAAVCRTAAKQRGTPLCLHAWTNEHLCAVEHVVKKLGDVFVTAVYLRRCAKISTINRGGLRWGVLSTVVRDDDSGFIRYKHVLLSGGLVPHPSLGNANER